MKAGRSGKMKQRTIRRPIRFVGVGLHSGQETEMQILPARPNTGIVFRRTDLEGTPEILAHYRNVVSTQLATTLGRGKVTISTVEHVLAALQGMAIDNAIVEVNSGEIPILDGSSAVFVEEIKKAGLESQAQQKAVLVLNRRVEVKVGEKWAVAEPSSELEVHASIEWDHPSVGYQEYRFIEGQTSFEELANARTFGFVRELDALRRMGLARGASLENVVALDDALVLNPEGLRSPDEFVRHKVLDALGDFKLAGISIVAKVRLHRAGHDLHRQLLAQIFSNPDNFEIVDGSEESEGRVAAARAAVAAAARLVAIS